MKELLKKMPVRLALGIVGGSAMGYMWYKIVGCPGGSCPLTSSPVRSMTYWSVVGVIAMWPKSSGNKDNAKTGSGS